MRSKAGHGYAALTDLGGLAELDTFTCQHGPCGKIVHVKAFQRPEDVGGQCKVCMGYVCKDCYSKGTCLPIEKWCEMVEKGKKGIPKIYRIGS